MKSQNLKRLIITEKYCVAKDFSEALGARRVENSFESKEYVIVWASGHLFNLMNPEDYKEKYKKWAFKELPIVPDKFKIKLINKKVFEPIKEQLKRATIDKILIATDAGREGELIGQYILKGANNKKPVDRIWLDSMTKADILKGLSTAKPIEQYNNLYLSASARAECDWLLGINYTRAYSLKYGQGKPLTVGRCQTPILALIVKRDQEIENFIPEEYWEVECTFKTGVLGLKQYIGKWISELDNSSRIKNKSMAEEICNRVKGKTGRVVKVSKEIKKVSPPLLYNQTNLQREANKKYGFTAQKTLDIAQALYEKHKILSYPRTATRYISSSIAEQLPDLLKLLNFDKFKKHVERILNITDVKNNSRIVKDEEVKEHTAIIPTINNELKMIYNTLTQDEVKIFDMVVLNLLANYYDDYKYNSISIQTEINTEQNNDLFITKGIEIIDLGWKAVYNNKNQLEQPEHKIVEVKDGSKVKADKVKMREQSTAPPARYNENSLLAIMENPTRLVSEEDLRQAIRSHGIGTDATRASIIETLIKRKYITRKGKELISTELGRELISVIEIDILKSVKLTAELEQKLEMIATGELKKDKLLNEVKQMVSEGIAQIRGD